MNIQSRVLTSRNMENSNISAYDKNSLFSSQYMEILLVTSGKGELISEDEFYSISEGYICVIPGGCDYRVNAGSKYSALLISGPFGLISHLEGIRMLKDNEMAEGRKLAELIHYNRNGNEGYLGVLCEAYSRFILMNVDHNPKNTSAAISRIVLRIEKEFSVNDLSVGRLLDESGYARDYIRQEFENTTGMTPKKYLNSVRMQKAKALIELCSDEMTIGEIAERCGVIDPTIFSRIFKKHFGISPSQYRESLRKKHDEERL